MTFTAVERGYYYASFFEYYGFSANVSSQLSFTVDTIPPNVAVLPMNKTLSAGEVSLSYALDESSARVAYSLDGKENVTVFGNFTLPALSFAEHNVTVYAWDAAGNVGASETVAFTVAKPESFPTMPIAASIATVAIVCVGLLTYFKKFKQDLR